MSANFHTTCWTMVLDAAKSSPAVSRPALEELCKQYWQPLHVYVRSHGFSEPDAEDVTQAFFAMLLERNLPGRADPERGRFRWFLLRAIRNFIQSHLRKAMAQKRGGPGGAELSLDDEKLNLASQLITHETPETAYERKWAHTLIQIAINQLAAEQAAMNQAERFEALRPLLFEPGNIDSRHDEVGAQLGLNVNAVRTALSRLRTRFRDLVRSEVARLVDDPAEVDDELAHLLRALRG